MPMATIKKVGGEHDLYHIHFLDQRTDPGYGHPGGGHPDNALPGYGHPDQGLPGSGAHPGNRPPGSAGGRPDQGLPGSQPGPDQGLPGGQRPGIPSNELPTTPPPQVAPGQTLVLVRKDSKWHYAVIPQGQPAPTPLPTPPSPPAQPKG